MKKLMIAFAAVVSLSSIGCKKKGGASDAMAKMEGFQKSMCDCKDKACADKVQEDMTKWGTEAAKNAKPDDKPDPDMVKKSGEIMTKYTECMTKLMTAAVDKPPGGDKAAGSDAPKAKTPDASKCVEGAYKDPAGAYCVKLPEGYKTPPDNAKRDGVVEDRFMSENNEAFVISVYDSKGMTWDNMKGTMAQQIEGNKPIETTDLEGGKAYWIKNHLVKSKQTATGYAVDAGDKVIGCWSLADDKTLPKPADACKSLRAM